MPDGQTVAHRRPVVHHVQAVGPQLQLVRELLDDLRQVVERVLELIHRRHRAVPEPGVVRCDQVELIRQ